jgi:hypothetical protein
LYSSEWTTLSFPSYAPGALRTGKMSCHVGSRMGVLANADGMFRLRHPTQDAPSVMQAKT